MEKRAGKDLVRMQIACPRSHVAHTYRHRGTSMQASSRSDEAPVNELTFNESELVASGSPAARN